MGKIRKSINLFLLKIKKLILHINKYKTKPMSTKNYNFLV